MILLILKTTPSVIITNVNSFEICPKGKFQSSSHSIVY